MLSPDEARSIGGGTARQGVSAGNDPALRHLAKLLHMLAGDAAGAEKKQPSHQRSPSSPSLCSLGPFSTSGSLAAEIGTFGAAAIIAQAGAGLCAQCTALRSTV